jgi:TRAP-type transport system periplasmic protein
MLTMRGKKFALTVVALAIAAAACSSADGTTDKVGGSGEPISLMMANPYGDLGQVPAVEYFVDRVGELSGGDIRITVADEYGGFDAGAEQQIVRDVSTGVVDLGWVGTRVFDTMGVENFRALTAPLLIDSYALQGAVIDAGITDEMVPALEQLGVEGLAVLADGLRKPVGVEAPIVGTDDWSGIGFGTFRSETQEMAIRTLDATPAEVMGGYREEAVGQGTIQAFEFGLFLYQLDPKWVRLAPYVTSDVTLWPQMDALIVDPDLLEAMTGEQREWLRQAADDAAGRSAALVDTDAQSIEHACQAGARFAEASDGGRATLEAAFEPVYIELESDPTTGAFIEEIRALKGSVSESPPTIPSGCTGRAPEEPQPVSGNAPAFLNGTYRFVLTQADADEVGDPDTGYPLVETIVLQDGRLDGGCFGVKGGTYSVDGDQITFHSILYDSDLTATFSVDDEGSLRLAPVPGTDPGDAFTCFYKPWEKID